MSASLEHSGTKSCLGGSTLGLGSTASYEDRTDCTALRRGTQRTRGGVRNGSPVRDVFVIDEKGPYALLVMPDRGRTEEEAKEIAV